MSLAVLPLGKKLMDGLLQGLILSLNWAMLIGESGCHDLIDKRNKDFGSIPLEGIIFIYYYITHDHKLSGLKQCTCTISQLLWIQNLGTSSLGDLLQLP